MMSKKDYKNVVDAINDANRFLNVSEGAVMRIAFHDMFTERYPNFDALEFWEALDTPKLPKQRENASQVEYEQ